MIANSHRPFAVAAIAVVTALSLSGCVGSAGVQTKPGEVSSAGQASASVGERAAAVALRQVGAVYRYGGASPPGFDCSGLVQYSYREAGKSLPRTTGQLWEAAGTVGYRDLQVGDLLFFRFDGKVSHVGIYVGDERFVHAPSAGKRVSVDSLNAEIYRRALIRGGRVH